MEETVPPTETAAAPPPQEARRARRAVRLVFALFCLEIGLVMVMLPWTLLWDNNYFSHLYPSWSDFWLSSYTRGAVSGLGVINVYIAGSEGLRLWK